MAVNQETWLNRSYTITHPNKTDMHVKLYTYTSTLLYDLLADILNNVRLCNRTHIISICYTILARILVYRYFFLPVIQFKSIDWMISFVTDASASEMQLPLNKANTLQCSYPYRFRLSSDFNSCWSFSPSVWHKKLSQITDIHCTILNHPLNTIASIRKAVRFFTFTARSISNYIYRKFAKQTPNQVREKKTLKSQFISIYI